MNKRFFFANAMFFIVIGFIFLWLMAAFDDTVYQLALSWGGLIVAWGGAAGLIYLVEFPSPLPYLSEKHGAMNIYAVHMLMSGWDQDDPRNYPKWQAVLIVWRDALRMWLGACYCKLFDHDIQSDGGWAGPDSGGDDFYCNRCGWSQHICYY